MFGCGSVGVVVSMKPKNSLLEVVFGGWFSVVGFCVLFSSTKPSLSVGTLI